MCCRGFQTSVRLNEDGTQTITHDPLEQLLRQVEAGNIPYVEQYMAEHKDFAIDHTFNCNQNLLFTAVRSKQYAEVAWLVEHGANPDYEPFHRGVSLYIQSPRASADSNDLVMQEALNSKVIGTSDSAALDA